MAQRRGVPRWLTTTGWVLLGVSALGLPTALVVVLLDTVHRAGPPLAQRVLVGGLVLLAVVLVVVAERALSHLARESVGWAVGAAAALVALVLAGVYLPTLGLVLVALGVGLGTPAALAGVGYLAWWRWQHGPRPAAREASSAEQVAARAEERRTAVRARHERTREAVRRGLVGPGFTRGT